MRTFFRAARTARHRRSFSYDEASSHGPASATLTVAGKRVTVRGEVTFDSAELAELVSAAGQQQQQQQQQQGARLRVLTDAATLGAQALSKATASQTGAVMSRDIQKQLAGHLEQTVTASVEELLAKANAATDATLRDIDPARKDSTLGRALGRVDELLDERRSDSVPAVFRESLRAATAADGALAAAVSAAVVEASRPLAGEVERLSKVVHAQAATSALRQKSPAKGIAFEEELVAALQPWKQGSRASVEHVGADNRQGDVVVRFPPTHAQRQQQQQQQQQTQTQYHQQQQEQFQQHAQQKGDDPATDDSTAPMSSSVPSLSRGFSVVIEAKDSLGGSPLGRKRIAKIMEGALSARADCHSG